MAKILAKVFYHSVQFCPKFGDNLYDYDFEGFMRKITFLHFIKNFFLRVYLILLEHIPLFPQFVCLCVGVYSLVNHPPLPVGVVSFR